MSLIWRCDRCRKTSDLGIAYERNEGENEPPDGWHRFTMPVRGSQGAQSLGEDLLCNECQDSLYAWLHASAEPETTA